MPDDALAVEGDVPRSGLSSPMSILSITLLPTPEPPRMVSAVLGSDSAFSDRGQLEESLFSSLRGEPAVLAAWVERTGAAPILLTLPSVGPPLEATFTTCRLAGSERVEAARGEVRIGEAPGPAFFLRRRISRPPQTLTITLAFIDEPESQSP
jgi:hypothetical protein